MSGSAWRIYAHIGRVSMVIRRLAMRCQLSTLMGKARYSIQDVHIKTGLARSTVTQLYHDKATRIDYDTIEKLCSLFNCGMSDLFVLEGTELFETEKAKKNEI